MAETLWLTNKVDEIAAILSPLITIGFLDDGGVYPHTLTDDVTGISIINTSDTDDVTITLTLEDTSTMSIPVPTGNSYTGQFGQNIVSIDRAGTLPSFTIELKDREV